MCVCERETEREGGRERERMRVSLGVGLASLNWLIRSGLSENVEVPRNQPHKDFGKVSQKLGSAGAKSLSWECLGYLRSREKASMAGAHGAKRRLL